MSEKKQLFIAIGPLALVSKHQVQAADNESVLLEYVNDAMKQGIVNYLPKRGFSVFLVGD